MKKIRVSSNMEDYIEAVHNLEAEKGFARVKDISGLLDVRSASTTGALSRLAEKGLIKHERYGYVQLTSAGNRLAEDIRQRHNTILKFLSRVLRIRRERAEKDACGMEHAISPETLKKLTKFIEFIETCPTGERPEWLKSFDHFYKTGKRLNCKVEETGTPPADRTS